MIDHERFLMLAAADVGGELDEVELAELESHLASCRSCRQEAARMRLDNAALIAASAEVPVPAATRAAVVAAIGRRPARAIWPGLAAAALLIIALAGTAFVAGSRGPSVGPDSPPPSLAPSQSPSPLPSPTLVPSLNPSPTSSPNSSPLVMSVNGAYAYLTSSDAERRDSVSVRDTDPVSGTWSRLVPPDGASLGGPVTCLEIDGQNAWLAGPATEDSDGETWRAALLFVHDSGLARGEGDLAVAWITDPGQSLETMEGWCSDHYTPAGPFPLIDGDIVIQPSP